MMEKKLPIWIAPVVLAVIAAAGLWYYWNVALKVPAAVEVAAVDPDVTGEAERIGPMHPIPDVDMAAGATSLRTLPDLDNSDQYFQLELTDLMGEQIGNLLTKSGIIEKVVATVDNLPRSHVAERLRPVNALSDAFVAEDLGDSGFVLGETSFRRFDLLVDIVAKTNVSDMTDLYRRYYSLFQSAYVRLGYPDGYFNDRLVVAIDDMLATPLHSEPIVLIRPHVLYQFADSDLESRSSGQKLLLRMGNENAAVIKEKLRLLRNEVAADIR